MATDPKTIRSFALVGHGGSGKTQTADALARFAGLNTRLGSPGDGTSLFDFEPEEQKRGGSITSHLLCCEADGHRFHVLDTPGDGNFLHDARVCLQAADAVVLVVSAVDGVEVSTERISEAAKELGLPRAVFINKMDRDRADHESVLAEVRKVLGMEPALLQIPIGTEASFRGVVDLVDRKALVYEGDAGKPVVGDVPADMSDDVDVAVEAMVEAIASVDDDLMEKYLENGALSQEEMLSGLVAGLAAGKLCPVVLGSAGRNIGIDRLLALARTFPDPTSRPVVHATHGKTGETVDIARDPAAPAVALCFKTIIDPFAGQISLFKVLQGTVRGEGSFVNARSGGNERFGTMFHLIGKKQDNCADATVGEVFGVAKLRDTRTGDTLTDGKYGLAVAPLEPPPPMISYTVRPKSRGEEDKVKGALARVLAEDGGLRQGYDEVTKEIVVSGMGANHIRLSLDRMARKYGIEVELGTPTIPYRETVTGTADVRYRHKKQTGGAGQFGEVAIKVFPNDRGAGFEFVDDVVGGVIPNQLIPSVEKGVRSALSKGILAGFPVVDLKVSLYDGKTHPVDSKDIAFQIAGRMAVKRAVMDARPVLLEPIYNLDIVVPEDCVGDIMGDMNGRRGRIQTMESRGRNSVVKVQVPLAEILNYAPDLNSMTGGKGSYTMQLSSYEPVPSHMQDKLVAEIKRVQEEEE